MEKSTRQIRRCLWLVGKHGRESPSSAYPPLFLLLSVIVGAVVGTQNGSKTDGEDQSSVSSAIKLACGVTLYPDSCYSSLSPLASSGNVKPQDIFKLSLQVALNELLKASGAFRKLNVTDKMGLGALGSCGELLSLAVDHFNSSLSVNDVTLISALDDLRTWLSTAETCQETCIDGFTAAASELSDQVSQILKNSTEFTSNSLSIVTSVESSLESKGNLASVGRRLLRSFDDEKGRIWSSLDRKLLQATTSQIKVDAVVAKDGSGKYKTIGAALKAVPQKSNKRFVIYVKKGIYVESVSIEKNMWDVLMIGDGKNATIVSGKLNVVDGTPTFRSATFAVFGKGFMARDMGFQNIAGPKKQQAVALMSTADLSVFYRCAMVAYQDTLYTHSNRQFYRECDIYGTVDFIFGNSAAVFQNCNIIPRKPIPGQQNTLTAQGKFDPNQNTGISIQNCTISQAENLYGVSTFLGRPWKNYSTTVYMQTMMGSLIDPKGWLPWTGTTAPNTIFYGEYQNYGPGGVTKNRVKWKGLRLNLSAKISGQFTVKSSISGNQWLSSYRVTFY